MSSVASESMTQYRANIGSGLNIFSFSRLVGMETPMKFYTMDVESETAGLSQCAHTASIARTSSLLGHNLHRVSQVRCYPFPPGILDLPTGIP